jgi:hypothetical protein
MRLHFYLFLGNLKLPDTLNEANHKSHSTLALNVHHMSSRPSADSPPLNSHSLRQTGAQSITEPLVVTSQRTELSKPNTKANGPSLGSGLNTVHVHKNGRDSIVIGCLEQSMLLAFVFI